MGLLGFLTEDCHIVEISGGVGHVIDAHAEYTQVLESDEIRK